MKVVPFQHDDNQSTRRLCFHPKQIMCYLDAAIISVRSRRQSNRQNNRQAQTANPSDVHFTTRPTLARLDVSLTRSRTQISNRVQVGCDGLPIVCSKQGLDHSDCHRL